MTRVPAGQLREFAVAVLAAAGLDPEAAVETAEVLVEADLRGIGTHGVFRLPQYAANLRSGGINPCPRVRLAVDGGAVAVLDADGGLGFVAGRRAADLAVERAAAFGVGAVAVRRSRHFGAAGYYAERIARAGCVGLTMTNAFPLLPAPGGAAAVVGNNPLAVAVPVAGRPPVVLDIAMSQVSLGRVRVARARGEAIPIGWGLDRLGRPTTDPGAVLDGGMLAAMGGHKGYGLAVAVELLAGALAGAAVGRDADSHGEGTRQGVGHLFVALNPGHFGERTAFLDRASRFCAMVKDSPLAPAHHEVFLPGEIEDRCRQERLANGIPIDPGELSRLRETARSLGVAAPFPD